METKEIPFGISSVMSIMDDILVEKIRKHYCEKVNLTEVVKTADNPMENQQKQFHVLLEKHDDSFTTEFSLLKTF